MNFIPSSGSDKDLVEIFSDAGKGIKKLFKSDRKKDEPPQKVSHGGFSVGVVYANDLAKAEIEKDKPQFPTGAIIVREKHGEAENFVPQTVIAMVKREKGFNKKSGDWEFFTFNGADLKMQKRETVGECAKCHMQAEKTDWVFRDYLQTFKIE